MAGGLRVPKNGVGGDVSSLAAVAKPEEGTLPVDTHLGDHMHIGVRLPHFGAIASDPAAAAIQILDVARCAEAVGLDSIWVGDHVTPGLDSPDRFGPTWYDGLTTLAFVASVTNHVRLGTAVLVAPYRHPLLVAKALATLDCLSGGRVDAGFGTGWMEAEFAALGLATFQERGRVTDESISVLKRILAGKGFDAHTPETPGVEYLPLPRPANPNGIPIWIGGNSARAARRVAELGDGWMLLRTGSDELQNCLQSLDRALEKVGRDRHSVHVGVEAALRFQPRALEGQPFLGPPQQIVDSLAQLESRGIDHVLFDMFYNAPGMEEVSIGEMLDGMHTLADVASSLAPR